MKTRLAGLAVLTSLALCAPDARAEDFIFVRPGDPDRIFKQDEALVIELPQNLSEAELQSLFLELDGTDITQRVTLEGARVVFYPASPYGAGTHALRLVRMGKNGKLVEIDRWNFNVAGGTPPVERSSSVSGSVEATDSYRVWDNYDDDVDEPDLNNLQSQAQVEATMQEGDWRLLMRGNGFLNSEPSANPGGDTAEVGEYLLRAENAGETLATTVSLGNHDIGASNLLMDQFYRRGASATFDLRQGRAVVSGFSMNPAAATGNRNIFGLDDPNQLATGAHATLQPLAALGDRLELEGTAYRGAGSTSGSGTGTTAGDPSDGRGYQLGVKSQLVRDMLGLRLQYADADFDADGSDKGLPSRSDQAYGVTFLLTPLKSKTDAEGRIRQWEIEPGYYRAGTYFDTLLNPSAENDREIWSVKSRYLYGNTSLDGEVSWTEDDVDDVAGLPRDGSLHAYAQGSWSPEKETWGAPVFSLGGEFSDDNRIDTPAGYTGGDLNRQTRSVNGGVVLSFEKTTWTFNQTYTVLDDKADEQSEYNTSYSDLGLEYRLNDRWTFRPGLQVEVLHENADGTSKAVHGSLGAQAVLIPDKLWNNTTYSMLLNNGSTPDGDTYNAETEFNWLLKKADANSPGWAIALAGLYDNTRDTADTTDREDEDLRIFARLKFSAPFAR